MNEIKLSGRNAKKLLGLSSSLVGVKFVFSEDHIPSKAEKLIEKTK